VEAAIDFVEEEIDAREVLATAVPAIQGLRGEIHAHARQGLRGERGRLARSNGISVSLGVASAQNWGFLSQG